MAIKRKFIRSGKEMHEGKIRYFSDWQLNDEMTGETVLTVKEVVQGNEANLYLAGNCRNDTYNYIRQELRTLYTADKTIVVHCDEVKYLANKIMIVLAETLTGIENLERGSLELRGVSLPVQKDLESIGMLNMLVVHKAEE